MNIDEAVFSSQQAARSTGNDLAGFDFLRNMPEDQALRICAAEGSSTRDRKWTLEQIGRMRTIAEVHRAIGGKTTPLGRRAIYDATGGGVIAGAFEGKKPFLLCAPIMGPRVVADPIATLRDSGLATAVVVDLETLVHDLEGELYPEADTAWMRQ